jgi:hypothetical protein
MAERVTVLFLTDSMNTPVPCQAIRDMKIPNTESPRISSTARAGLGRVVYTESIRTWARSRSANPKAQALPMARANPENSSAPPNEMLNSLRMTTSKLTTKAARRISTPPNQTP